MTLDEFDEHDLYSLQLAIDGFQQLQIEKEKSEWNRVRWQTWHLLNIQLEKPLKRPTDLVLFEWEKAEEKATKSIDPAIIERLEKAFDNHAKQNP